LKVVVLTSSRADYSIYYPLLIKLKENNLFDLTIIAFGTHLSDKYGSTIQKILEDGFDVKYKIETLPESDSPFSISKSMGSTIAKFSSIWEVEIFDLVICLGDRFEMFSAISSTIPFNLKIAHIHGGEETLGAIDNVFRHSITHMSKYHFTATEQYKKRVIQLVKNKKFVYNVGSLSFDNIKNLNLLSVKDFETKFKIDLSIPTILITFHPETVSSNKNEKYILELLNALEEVNNLQLVFTMPNSDPDSEIIRKNILNFNALHSNSHVVESFGTIGYLSCMKYCKLMLGNTSSGFAEAAYFNKKVINLGKRQLGRIVTSNIINCKIKKSEILDAIYSEKISLEDLQNNINIYGKGDSASRIIETLIQIKLGIIK
jgi:GDP/UDP-N,N'-diacetylbacillosamine 2-epimerase (hydrolysing)